MRGPRARGLPLPGVVLAAVGSGSSAAGRAAGRGPCARPHLLVLRALGLGDLLTAVPALRALRDAYPGHRLVLAAPAALAPLAALIGAVDEVRDTGPLAPLDTALAGADLAVNLHGRGPESHRVLLAVRPRLIIAFAHREVPESESGPWWRAGEHEVVRWCRLLSEFGVPADPARIELGRPPEPAVRGGALGATLVHPGAASAARCWPPERFAAVARAEREAGRPVVVTGSPRERGLAEAVARRAGLPADAIAAGRTGLLDLAGLVAAAGRVVCGDTGVGHLATALGTPSVVLFGPTSPAEWGPPPDRPQHRALWAGQTGDPHAGRPDPGLLELAVDDVIAALHDLPGASAARATAAA